MPEAPTDRVRPDPDPTKLTQDAVDRAEKLMLRVTEELKELLRAEMKGESNKNREKFHWLNKRIEDAEASLREHIGAQFAQISIALEAADKAVSKAEASNDKRFEDLVRTIDVQLTAVRQAHTDLTKQISPLIGGNG